MATEELPNEALEYVYLNGNRNCFYRIVDDKTVDGVRRFVLMQLDGRRVIGYVEAYPDEVEPVDRSKL